MLQSIQIQKKVQNYIRSNAPLKMKSDLKCPQLLGTTVSVLDNKQHGTSWLRCWHGKIRGKAVKYNKRCEFSASVPVDGVKWPILCTNCSFPLFVLIPGRSLYCDEVVLMINESTQWGQTCRDWPLFLQGMVSDTCYFFYHSSRRCWRSQLLPKPRRLWEALVLHCWPRWSNSERILCTWDMQRLVNPIHSGNY